jgi:hypothetical protein
VNPVATRGEETRRPQPPFASCDHSVMLVTDTAAAPLY